RLKEIPNAQELKYSLAEALPQPTELYVKSVQDWKFRRFDNFRRGQELERLYWENPDSGLEARVFRNYAVVGAFNSARRFYQQARGNILDPVTFSNGMGREVYMVGYCLNDERLRASALEDSNSGSASDMMMHLWEAAVMDRPKEMQQI